MARDESIWRRWGGLGLGFAALAPKPVDGAVADGGWAPLGGLTALRAAAGRERSPKAVANRYAAVLEAAGELVVHFDREGEVLELSEGVRGWLHSESREFLGSGLFRHVHVADRPQFLQSFHDALRGEAVIGATLRLRSGLTVRTEDGFDEPVFVWGEIRMRRLQDDPDGAAVVGVLRDVSAVKDMETTLATTRAEAAIAAAMKDRLLANVSHELRTPLNAILGFSEMLGDPALTPAEPERRQEYARIINTSAQHLLSVVNLLLDMSRIEAGKFELAPATLCLQELIGECCDMLRLKAEAGKVKLVVDAEPRPPLVADKRACRQILLNLLSNAVKFTPENGSVHVALHAEAGGLRVEIQDTGIGIAPEDLPHLGQPFFQVRSGYERHFEGAGLGLALVRGLVELHGGAVTLESAPGAGTRVSLLLPWDCRAVARAAETGAIRLETAPKAADVAGPASMTWDCKERRIA